MALLDLMRALDPESHFYTVRLGVTELVAGIRIARLIEEGQPFGDRPSPIPRTTVDLDRR
jgi:hypothetical protein